MIDSYRGVPGANKCPGICSQVVTMVITCVHFEAFLFAGGNQRLPLRTFSGVFVRIWNHLPPLRAGGGGAFHGGEGGDGDAGGGVGPYGGVAGVQGGAGREGVVHKKDMAGRCEDRGGRFPVKPGMTAFVMVGSDRTSGESRRAGESRKVGNSRKANESCMTGES